MNISKYKSYVSISTRSLAVFRMGMGILLAADVLLRSRNFWYYYTEHGVVPYSVSASHDHIPGVATFPIWEVSTHSVFVFFVFFAAFVVGIALAVGWKSKVMIVLAFLLTSAIDARNIFVLSYADIYYHKLLFFAIFLPLGERWGLDAINNTSNATDKSVAGFASTAILLQIVGMYFINGLLKSYPNGEHAAHMLPLLVEYDFTTFTQATLLASIPDSTLEIFSLAWVFMLFSTPFILLLFRNKLRAIGTIPLFSGHLVMAAMFRIGAFPYITIIALILFIQDDVWDDFSNHTSGITLSHTEKVTQAVDRIVKNIYRSKTIEKIQTSLNNIQSKSIIKPTTDRLDRRFVILALVCLLVLGNAATVTSQKTEIDVSQGVEKTTKMLGLTQPSWGFYTNTSLFADSWYVYPSTTENGTQINAYNEPTKPVTYERPYKGVKLHYQFDRTYRDRFFEIQVHINKTEKDRLRQARLEYICKNKEYNGEEITNITMKKVESSYNMANKDDTNRQREIKTIASRSCS